MQKKSREQRIIGDDLRGKHMTNRKRMDPNVIQEIREHITSFPSVESHYCRKSSSRKFLPADLDVTNMYDLFGKQDLVKPSLYRIIFREYNLSFHKPKKDLCSTCTKYRLAKQSLPITEETESNGQIHLKKKVDSRASKEENKQAALNDSTLKVFTFDLQAVLSSPCGEVSNYYYARKFATYNLTIYDMGNSDG